MALHHIFGVYFLQTFPIVLAWVYMLFALEYGQQWHLLFSQEPCAVGGSQFDKAALENAFMSVLSLEECNA